MRRRPGTARRVLLKAELAATRVRERSRAWRSTRWPVVRLAAVQRRLELLVAALYGAPIPVAPLDREPPTWLERAWRALDRGETERHSTPATDGAMILLPRELPARDGADHAAARFRLFAIEQAERIVRGTLVLTPRDDLLVRDLYFVREAAAVDGRIAAAHRGLRGVLRRERAAAHARRPTFGPANAIERAVESLVRDTLAEEPAAADASEGPAASVLWARATAERLRATAGETVYRGVAPVQLWGAARPVAPGAAEWRREQSRPMETIVARKYSWGRTEADSEASTGRTHAAAEKYAENDASSAVPDAERRENAARRDAQPAGTDARPSARAGASAAPHDASELDRPDLAGLPPAVWYDEWDADAGAYVERKAGVRVLEPVALGEGDDWTRRALAEHAALVRKVRHQFERLRARRMLLPRQRSGDEIDVAAVVSAMSDGRRGQGGEDRLYLAARPARRGLAIAMLVDASGSTKSPLADGRRIIDLEKVALLVAMEALDALGDRYAAYAFAGRSAENVALVPIRHFRGGDRDLVRRRVSALEPGGFTRLGAAVRHVTAQLAAERAGHRLLLLLSDGRPNDVDRYQGDYGVEDSRQAIVEARASGVYPFCITIDREASDYLPRIFGEAGHTIVTRPEQLPAALVGVVRGLIRRG